MKTAGFSPAGLLSGALLSVLLVLSGQPLPAAYAADVDECLARRIAVADDAVTIGALRQICSAETESEAESEAGQISASARFFNFTESPFETYKANYFSIGGMRNADGSDAFSGNSVDVKFQFSIKYRIFNPGFLLSPLHFAYTQTSWWDVGEDSLPFAEHNFNPEFFWLLPEFSIFDYPFNSRVGVEHLSNGRAGPESRSLDRIYGEAELSLNNSLALHLKLWNTVNVADENSDYAHYLGNARIGLLWRFSRDLSLQLNGTKGHGNSKYNLQTDLIYQLPSGINPAIFLTYYNGYGESLLSYQQKSESLRLGFFFAVPL